MGYKPFTSYATPGQAEQGVLFDSPVVSTSATVVVEARTEAIPSHEAEEILQRSSRSTGIQGQTHLLSAGPAWTWEQLRDYVVQQIEQRWGARPRDPLKEAGIFKSFISRWGDQSQAIARAAFEVYGGSWNGAPVSVERFSKGSDRYFAELISQNL